MFTVEDYIELLASMKKSDRSAEFSIDRSDYNLITSLARQTVKGMSYTDRQYDLAKKKLIDYKEQFEKNGYANIENDFENLRMPLRSIDRRRWIKIVNYPENTVYEASKTNDWIAVRFVFNKKLISVVETIRSTDKDAIYNNMFSSDFSVLELESPLKPKKVVDASLDDFKGILESMKAVKMTEKEIINLKMKLSEMPKEDGLKLLESMGLPPDASEKLIKIAKQ